MTMQAFLVNAGNRTGDKLTIIKDGKSVTINRGQKFDIWEFMSPSEEHAPSIKIVCEYGDGEDEFVGEAQVTVTDPPRSQ